MLLYISKTKKCRKELIIYRIKFQNKVTETHTHTHLHKNTWKTRCIFCLENTMYRSSIIVWMVSKEFTWTYARTSIWPQAKRKKKKYYLPRNSNQNTFFFLHSISLFHEYNEWNNQVKKIGKLYFHLNLYFNLS